MNATRPMVVAVAGGTGFVGRAIARELLDRGHRVVVLSHKSAPNAGAPKPDGASTDTQSVEVRQADVTRPESLSAALSGVDALVISLGFRNSPIESPRRGQTFELVDAAGTEALVAAAKAANAPASAATKAASAAAGSGGAGIRRLVYMSGAGAAPDAARHWFRAKWRAEEAVRGSGIAYTIFRPSWIYGPGDHSLNRFLGFARWLPFVPQIGNGRQRLVPILVTDMGALVADALASPAAENATLEVGGPETLTMDEIVRTALRVSRRRRPILHAPMRLMKLLVRPLTLLPSPPMTPDAIDFVVQSAPVDIGPLTERLPRRLTPLAEGLATYMAPRPR